MEYSTKNKLQFVLVIDRDENALASRKMKVLTNESELIRLLNNKAAEFFPEEALESPPAKETN